MRPVINDTKVIEDYLESHYLGKYVEYSPIGKPKIVSKIDRITVDTSRNPYVVIFVLDDNIKHEEELESFTDLITLVK